MAFCYPVTSLKKKNPKVNNSVIKIVDQRKTSFELITIDPISKIYWVNFVDGKKKTFFELNIKDWRPHILPL